MPHAYQFPTVAEIAPAWRSERAESHFAPRAPTRTSQRALVQASLFHRPEPGSERRRRSF